MKNFPDEARGWGSITLRTVTAGDIRHVYAETPWPPYLLLLADLAQKGDANISLDEDGKAVRINVDNGWARYEKIGERPNDVWEMKLAAHAFEEPPARLLEEAE